MGRCCVLGRGLPTVGNDGWRCRLRGATARGGACFLWRKQEKEHQGALPPGPPLGGGGSSPETPFSGCGGPLGGAFFRGYVACGPRSHRLQASRPPAGRLGTIFITLRGSDRFTILWAGVLSYGPVTVRGCKNRKNRKRTHRSRKNSRKIPSLFFFAVSIKKEGERTRTESQDE